MIELPLIILREVTAGIERGNSVESVPISHNFPLILLQIKRGPEKFFHYMESLAVGESKTNLPSQSWLRDKP